MTAAAQSAERARTLAGVRATYAAFIATGFVFASWASRIPHFQDQLGLSPGRLGLLLLAIAVGSLISLPMAGAIVDRFGSRRTVAVMAVLDGLAVVLVAIGYEVGVPLVALGLVFFGFAQGGWDVAMNVQGAVAERRLGQAIMPRFHAGFSLGTVAGALLGALLVGLGVAPSVHLLVVGLVIAAAVPTAVRNFLPDTETEAEPGAPAAPRTSALVAWTEPRTLLIGLFVLTFAFAEGSGNDWAGVALIDGYGTSDSVGTLGFALFLTAMTVGRWFGPHLLARFGRVVLLQAMAAAAALGVLLFVLAPNAPLAFAGALLWGLGTALGFPVGMSAAADEPARAPARVSVVASIGYCAFLGGPPLVGLLGDTFSVLSALLAVAVAMAVGFLVAPATREPKVLEPQR
ncbi:MFS transporter [Kineosporia sp. NBRC 101677]|uniref:MFS transporter n=1 Tax=Kineosporia sp. NBRC 101677 TaxID=3032197 RepID=UPI0024A2FE0D|nr:MFS transporter [Kineosporia sp. NBRC 101677]GLY16040.1 MFS transporter [Kineosporia sp. NBRC 101677]